MNPSSELISEFKVTEFNNNAEFAQLGDVTITTKSGTEHFHGSLFEYFQNGAFDAAVWGSNINGQTIKPHKAFHTFGGSLGGPVVPHGNTKTFFFVDYEGNRKRYSTPLFLFVPTNAMRRGDFSALCQTGFDATGICNAAPRGSTLSAVQLQDPFTGQAYPSNLIPSGNACSNSQDCINPVATSLLNFHPSAQHRCGRRKLRLPG